MFPARCQGRLCLTPGMPPIGNTEGGSKNYDYQDAVYLLVNAKPESAALDPSVPGPLPGEPSLVFDFNQTYAGSLNDKMGDYWLYQYPTQQERYLHEAKCPTPQAAGHQHGWRGYALALQLQVATLKRQYAHERSLNYLRRQSR